VVVKLVITSACHAEGRGFKSRPPRQISLKWLCNLAKEHKKLNQKIQNLEHANKALIGKNGTLGSQNEQLKSKIKALEADVKSKDMVIEESNKREKTAVTIIEQPEDISLKILDKIYSLNQDDRVHKQLTEEERAQSALKLQQQFLEQQYVATKREQELRSQSPEVVESRLQGAAKRKSFFVCQILGGIFSIIGVFLLLSLIQTFSAIVLYVGGGLLATGVLLFLVGVVPYLSAEDADKLEKLSKVFKTALPAPTVPKEDSTDGRKS
jgi:hypothetical protein